MYGETPSPQPTVRHRIEGRVRDTLQGARDTFNDIRHLVERNPVQSAALGLAAVGLITALAVPALARGAGPQEATMTPSPTPLVEPYASPSPRPELTAIAGASASPSPRPETTAQVQVGSSSSEATTFTQVQVSGTPIPEGTSSSSHTAMRIEAAGSWRAGEGFMTDNLVGNPVAMPRNGERSAQALDPNKVDMSAPTFETCASIFHQTAWNRTQNLSKVYFRPYIATLQGQTDGYTAAQSGYYNTDYTSQVAYIAEFYNHFFGSEGMIGNPTILPFPQTIDNIDDIQWGTANGTTNIAMQGAKIKQTLVSANSTSVPDGYTVINVYMPAINRNITWDQYNNYFQTFAGGGVISGENAIVLPPYIVGQFYSYYHNLGPHEMSHVVWGPAHTTISGDVRNDAPTSLYSSPIRVTTESAQLACAQPTATSTATPAIVRIDTPTPTPTVTSTASNGHTRIHIPSVPLNGDVRKSG